MGKKKNKKEKEKGGEKEVQVLKRVLKPGKCGAERFVFQAGRALNVFGEDAAVIKAAALREFLWRATLQSELSACKCERVVVVMVEALTEQVEQIACLAKSNLLLSLPKKMITPGSNISCFPLFPVLAVDIKGPCPPGAVLATPDPEKGAYMVKKFATIEDLIATDYEFGMCAFPDPDFEGFVRADKRPAGVAVDENMKVLAMDCEMCETEFGLEIARVSVVDFSGNVLLDCLVKPTHDVTNYLTHITGITKDDLDAKGISLADAQKALKGLIFSDTILVGHSLNNDLAHLGFAHRRIVDTSLVFRVPLSYSNAMCATNGGGSHFFKFHSLRFLATSFGVRDESFQSTEHSSISDAQTTLDVLKFLLSKGWEAATRCLETLVQQPQKNKSLFAFAAAQGLKTLLLASPYECVVTDGLPESCCASPVSDLVSQVRTALQSETRLVWCVVKDIAPLAAELDCARNYGDIGLHNADYERHTTRKLQASAAGIDDAVEQIIGDCPSGTLVVVCGTEGVFQQAYHCRRTRISNGSWTDTRVTTFKNQMDQTRTVNVRMVLK